MAIKDRVGAAVAASIAGLLMAAVPAVAQDKPGTYPNRPVTFVVPYPAGGGLDVFARQLAQKLSERMGQTFVIENRPGAGTVIGAAHVAKSAPDGYTIMLGTSSPFAINVTLNKSLPYDPAKHFAPIIYTSDAPFLLLVHSAVPVKTVGEWIKWVNAQPKPPSYGTAGPGSPQHLSMELLKSLTGHEARPRSLSRRRAGAQRSRRRSHPDAVRAADAGAAAPAAPARCARSEFRRPSGSARWPPSRPSRKPALPGFDFASWQMIVAPAGTPKPIVDRLHRELKAILATPEMKKDFEDTGRICGRQPAAGATARIHAQRDRAARQGGRGGGDRAVAVAVTAAGADTPSRCHGGRARQSQVSTQDARSCRQPARLSASRVGAGTAMTDESAKQLRDLRFRIS